MILLIALGAGLVVFGAVMIVHILQTMHRAQGTANWPTTPGQITAALVYRHERTLPEGTRVTFTPVVEYAYEVAGSAYAGHKRSFQAYDENSYADETQAEAAIRLYRVGERIKVHYNPADPQQAALVVQKPTAHHVVLLFGVICVVMGLGITALGVWLRMIGFGLK